MPYIMWSLNHWRLLPTRKSTRLQVEKLLLGHMYRTRWYCYQKKKEPNATILHNSFSQRTLTPINISIVFFLCWSLYQQRWWSLQVVLKDINMLLQNTSLVLCCTATFRWLFPQFFKFSIKTYYSFH